MRRPGNWLLCWLMVLWPVLLPAQQETPHPVLTISVEQVLSRSAYGRALSTEINSRFSALFDENRRIEMELEAEELALVERREELGDEAFRPIAEEFDSRVRRIRAEQQAKLQAIEELRNQAYEPFQQRLLPIIAEIADEYNADLVIEIERVLFSRRSVDVTDDVIAAFDRLYEERQFEVLPSEIEGGTDPLAEEPTLPDSTDALPEPDLDLDMNADP